jgi:hypothetical protein
LVHGPFHANMAVIAKFRTSPSGGADQVALLL